jgi:hypothetical protein
VLLGSDAFVAKMRPLLEGKGELKEIDLTWVGSLNFPRWRPIAL